MTIRQLKITVATVAGAMVVPMFHWLSGASLLLRRPATAVAFAGAVICALAAYKLAKDEWKP